MHVVSFGACPHRSLGVGLKPDCPLDIPHLSKKRSQSDNPTNELQDLQVNQKYSNIFSLMSCWHQNNAPRIQPSNRIPLFLPNSGSEIRKVFHQRIEGLLWRETSSRPGTLFQLKAEEGPHLLNLRWKTFWNNPWALRLSKWTQSLIADLPRKESQ